MKHQHSEVSAGKRLTQADGWAKLKVCICKNASPNFLYALLANTYAKDIAYQVPRCYDTSVTS